MATANTARAIAARGEAVPDQPAEKESSAADLVERMSSRVSRTLEDKIAKIQEVTRRSKILAINASIESVRSGTQGRGFSVIAEEMTAISRSVESLSQSLRSELTTQINELRAQSRLSVASSAEKRLIDLSLNAVELIDRNLYERSCDVRWWATDAAVVDCAASATPELREHASQRLGVILNAYTVYLDLWLCDASGRVIANGRPNRYRIDDVSVSGERWFQGAMRTQSGDDFVCADIAERNGLNGAPVATYATAIREGGKANGRVIGVLGVHFDWKPQAHAIVSGLRLSADEWTQTRAMLLDRNGLVLASSDGHGELSEKFPLKHGGSSSGAYRDDAGAVVGFALTPGYETYKGMGWYGCLVSRPSA
jgi:hypothetical protein